MPHLLNVWPQVRRQVQRAGHILLLLDYDGTLAPLAPRPELAVLPEDARRAVSRLHRRERYTVGLVSGRGLADLTGMVDLPGLIYAGNHGLEIQGPGLEFLHPAAAEWRGELAALVNTLENRLGGYDGVLVEGKGLTLSVHYRLTPEEQRAAVAADFMAAVAELQAAGRARVTRGKAVLEVRPAVDWDKGKAIARIAAEFPAGTLPIFFGDDLTDEDGFAAVAELGGISVLVGPARQPTRAAYRVDSPREVAETLTLLAD